MFGHLSKCPRDAATGARVEITRSGRSSAGQLLFHVFQFFLAIDLVFFVNWIEMSAKNWLLLNEGEKKKIDYSQVFDTYRNPSTWRSCALTLQKVIALIEIFLIACFTFSVKKLSVLVWMCALFFWIFVDVTCNRSNFASITRVPASFASLSRTCPSLVHWMIILPCSFGGCLFINSVQSINNIGKNKLNTTNYETNSRMIKEDEDLTIFPKEVDLCLFSAIGHLIKKILGHFSGFCPIFYTPFTFGAVGDWAKTRRISVLAYLLQISFKSVQDVFYNKNIMEMQ